MDTWSWDGQAQEGFQEIIANDKGRFQPQTVELLKGLHAVLKAGNLLAYLVSITLRVAEIHRVLKPTGSFYLHCDPSASHYLKLLLDAIFGPEKFLNEIVWKRTSAHSAAKRWGDVHDTLLFYCKDRSRYLWKSIEIAHTGEYASRYKNEDGDGRRWSDDNLTGPGTRGGESGASWRGFDPTAKGFHWKVSNKAVSAIVGESKIAAMKTLEKIDLLDEHGLIHWPKSRSRKEPGFPRFKRYLGTGMPIQDVITDISPLNSQAAERLGYPTQKPEALLEGIISASSNEGDVVLDPFCGCGTTVAVAQRLNRRWIGMDITYQSIALILRRLHDSFGKDISDGVALNGIPRDMASANALAHKKDDRVRKEFEKWAVLTYTANRATINQKKGADGGIDGTAYFLIGKTETDKMVLQVKSGHVGRGDIAKLKGDMQRENAALATFITLEDFTGPMRTEAKTAGSYRHVLMGRDYDKIELVTIKDMLQHNKRLDMPLSVEVLRKSAQRADGAEQLVLEAV